MTSLAAEKKGEPTISESTIRLMTRLALQHGAINLSQGFPDEPPPRAVRLALAYTVLHGKPPPISSFLDDDDDKDPSVWISTTKIDVTNQYSPPMGRPDLRQAVSDHYKRLYDYSISPNEITTTLGATEAVASALRSVGKPGDKVVILEPFHELYPNQCKIFYLEPTFVTLRQQGSDWNYDPDEMRQALSEARILLLNSPHNPTGKVFSYEELKQIVEWCQEFDVFIITDEIYEHMIYTDTPHYILSKEFPAAASNILLCNSIGKSASATGWRLGWCLHPPALTDTYRGIHDQMVVMSPHPMQVAALTYLQLGREYFEVELRQRYKSRIERLVKTLRKVGFEVAAPEGAYYVFANYTSVPQLKQVLDKDGATPMDVAMYMLKDVGIACVPGDNFYGKAVGEGNCYLRFAACRSDVEEACSKLEEKLLGS